MKNPSPNNPRLHSWSVALPDTGPEQGTVVETFERQQLLPGKELYVVGQVYSSRKRKENAKLLSRIVSELENALRANTKTETEKAFEHALARTNRHIKDERRTNFKNYTLKIHIAVVLRHGETLYASRVGHGVIVRERNGSLTHITRRPLYSSDPNHHLVFQEIITARLRSNDRLFLGTPQIYKIGEATLTGQISEDGLNKQVLDHRSDLRNLGLIMLQHPPKQPQTDNATPKGAAWPKQLRDALPPKKPILLVLAVLAISILLVWAIQAQEVAVSQQQAEEALIEDITTLEEKTTALIELENYDEAEQLLEQTQEKIQQLEQRFGESTTSNTLEERARYLSSLLPIVEN